MDELKLGQFNRISNSRDSKGVEFLNNSNINIYYSIPVEESPTPLLEIGCQGYNYLHVASQNSDLPSVNKLINLGVNLLQLTADGRKTPLLLSNTQADWKGKYVWQMKGKIRDKMVIETLLSAQVKSGNPLNAQCVEHKITHLHLASAIDHANAVEMFSRNGECLNNAVTFDTCFLPGFTALHFAVYHSSVKSARILLKYGADINLKDANGVSALHLLLERLLENVDFFTCGKRESCLQYNEERVSLEFIVSAILNTRTEDTIDDTGLTILHLACLLRDTSTVENYLKIGLNPNASANNNSKLWPGWTALHFAACANLKTFMLLIRNGASLLVENAKDETPLDFCMRRYPPNVVHTILTGKNEFRNVFFNDGVSNLLDIILSMAECDFTAKFKKRGLSVPFNSPLWPGYTLLHLAVSMNEKVDLGQNMYKDFYSEDEYNSLTHIYNCTDDEEQSYRQRIEPLLASRCSVDAKDAEGLTPVELAFKLHRATVVEKLLNASADYTNLWHFHIACAVGNLNFVKRCVLSGLNINAPVKSGFEWYGRGTCFDSIKKKPPLFRVRENSTALHIAVIFGRKAIVRCLLDKGADTCARDALDLTPIHLSMAYEFKTIGEMLLRSNLRESVTKDGLSHLHVAANVDDDGAIERLVAMGANVNSLFETSDKELLSLFRNRNRMTPLHVTMTFSTPHAAAIRALLEAGADIHARGTEKRAYSPLVSALGCLNEEHIEYFDERLMNDERVVGPIEPNGLTILHFACRRLNFEWVKRLLERGADPNARIRYDGDFRYAHWNGDSPLHVLVEQACWAEEIPRNLVHMVKLLLDYGADVTRIEEKPETVVHRIYDLLFDSDWYHNQETWPKKKAILLSIVDMLLKSQKSYAINPINNYRLSHFHIACARDNVEIVDEFLGNGVDINAMTDPMVYEGDGGLTSLHFAMKHKAERVARLLMDRGVDIKVEDVDGNTPVHVAVKEGFHNLELIEILLRRGVDINAKNLDGTTALMYLFMSQDFTLVQFTFFLANGSTVDLEYVAPDFTGIIGLAMKNAVPNDRLSIFKKMIDSYDVKTAVKNNFNAIQSLVSVKHDGTLTFHFYLNVIKQLIEMGFDLDQQDEEGKTSLHHATSFCNHDAVKALLLLGANINIIDNHKESPLTIESVKNAKVQDARRIQVAKLLTSHVWKLMFLKLEVNSVNKDAMNETAFSNLRILTLQKQCEEELNKAKLLRICQFLSFGDFLSDSVVCKFLRMTMSECKVVDTYFECEHEIFKEFPQFSGIMMMQYRKASANLNSFELMDLD